MARGQGQEWGRGGRKQGPLGGSQWGEGVGARLLELRARGKLARRGRGQGGKELDRGWRKTHGGLGRGQTQGQGDWSLGAGALMALGSGGLRRGTRAFLEPHYVLPSYPHHHPQHQEGASHSFSTQGHWAPRSPRAGSKSRVLGSGKGLWKISSLAQTCQVEAPGSRQRTEPRSLPPHPLTSPRCWQRVLGIHLEL